MDVPASGIYAESGMATLHNTGCLKTERFRTAYRRGIKAAAIIKFSGGLMLHVGQPRKQSVREKVILSSAALSGIHEFSHHELLGLEPVRQEFYLVDTFEGFARKYFPDEEKAVGYAEKNRKALAQGDYVYGAESVKKNFEEWPRAYVVQGFVPKVLKDLPATSVAFVHLDMNNVTPEKAAAEYFWPLMIRGVMLLDDYAFIGYGLSKKGMDDFADAVGVEILSLPTGQGILIKH